ncbi:hypothetical protein GCM10010399_15580 [Dactylosporangium fulvum]|uniref:Carrier domain-containing protein n=1 Tax=Dactylosporangium fulvum TaxID=53359 RepID=A0ABY5VQW2_9ACTN|nr:hypothetical protein [Dactylosporangium fulvum]UWP80163.1 hypothetical protein Dfulv_34065 [Dactylosporangium fulvum]
MDADDYRHKFAEFLATQPIGDDLAYEQIVRAQSRDELGITSLNMIMVLMNYIKKYTNDTVTLRPEWVLRLNDVDGIVSVLREIDASAVEPARS